MAKYENRAEIDPWDRQDGEPILWYKRFDAFRAMGTKRSLLRLFKDEQVASGKRRPDEKVNDCPPSWRKASLEWNWRGRAEAWDTHEIDREREQERIERDQERRQRLTMLKASRQVLGRKIANLAQDESALDSMSATSLIQSMSILFREQRQEYGDNVERIELSGSDGGPVKYESRHLSGIDLDELSIEQLEILKSLADRTRGAGQVDDDEGMSG